MSLLEIEDGKSLLRNFEPVEHRPGDSVEAFFSSFTYAWESNWFGNSYIRSRMRGESYDKITQLTGKSPFNAAGLDKEDMSKFRGPMGSDNLQEGIDNWILQQRQVDARFNEVMTNKEIEQKAYQDASDTQQKALAEAERGEWLSMFGGQVLGSFTDPINIAASFVGFGPAKLAVIAAREAVINAAVEVVQTPWRADWEEKMGRKYGLKEAAIDIGAGAVFGAVIPTSVVATGRALKFSDGRIREAFSMGSDYFQRLIGRSGFDEQTNDALAVMAKQAHIDEMNPVTNPTVEDVNTHYYNVEEAERAYNAGERPTFREFVGLMDQQARGGRESFRDFTTAMNDPKAAARAAEFQSTEVTEGAMEDLRPSLQNPDMAEANLDAEFETLLRDNPDLTVVGEDGDLTLRQIDLEMKAEAVEISAIERCAL